MINTQNQPVQTQQSYQTNPAGTAAAAASTAVGGAGAAASASAAGAGSAAASATAVAIIPLNDQVNLSGEEPGQAQNPINFGAWNEPTQGLAPGQGAPALEGPAAPPAPAGPAGQQPMGGPAGLDGGAQQGGQNPIIQLLLALFSLLGGGGGAGAGGPQGGAPMM